MAQEIERKFIVNDSFPVYPTGEWGDSIHFSYQNIVQGYFKGGDVRVRIVAYGLYEEDPRAYITMKSKRDGMSRHEFEYDIPVEDAHHMMELFCEHRIEKTRYAVKEEGKKWEVDVFKGDNEGLILAEIELDSEDEEFKLPYFVGKEVTSDKRYYNKRLAKNPYKKWKRLYTSYFNCTDWDTKNAVSIARSHPGWYYGEEYNKLAPLGWFLNKYKSDGDEEFYREWYYKDVLDKLDPEEVYNDLGQDAVLLCWEKPGQFCHRHIVAKWLSNALEIDIKEIGEY